MQFLIIQYIFTSPYFILQVNFEDGKCAMENILPNPGSKNTHQSIPSEFVFGGT